MLGTGLILLFNRTTPRWKLVLFLIIEGAGVGNVFQPTLVAAQAHSLKRDRAVVIGVRNFLRGLGGSVGLALSSAVFSNELKRKLNSLSTPLPGNFKEQILASVLRVPDLSVLTTAEKEEVLDAYMSGSKAVFILWVPIIGICFLLCFLIKDRGLTRPEEKPQVQETSASEPRAGDSDVEMQLKEPPEK